MRLFLIFCLGSSLLCGATYKRNQEQFFNYRTIRLENPFLVVTFAPDQLGRIASLKLKQSNTELINEFKLSRYTETPLFFLDSGNFQGVRELFWRRNISGIAPMRPVRQEKYALAFRTSNYGSTDLGLTRKITVAPDGLALDVESVFTNHGQTPEKIAVWLNLQGAQPAIPVIPVLGKGKVPQRGETVLYHRPFIFTGAGGNSHLPPAAEWAGFRLPGRKAVWVANCSNLQQGGFFYSWGNQDKRPPIRTVEPVMPELLLKSGGKSTPCRYRIIVFPGLENINALCGTTGLEVRKTSGGKTAFVLCNALPVRKEEKILLTLRDDRNKEIFRKNAVLPVRKAGSICMLYGNFSGKAAAGTVEINGKIADIYFEKDN